MTVSLQCVECLLIHHRFYKTSELSTHSISKIDHFRWHLLKHLLHSHILHHSHWTSCSTMSIQLSQIRAATTPSSSSTSFPTCGRVLCPRLLCFVNSICICHHAKSKQHKKLFVLPLNLFCSSKHFINFFWWY